MAVFKDVNHAIKKQFPSMDIKVIRGDGYIYFDGDDGFGKIDSIYVNPITTSTCDVINLCIDAIK